MTEMEPVVPVPQDIIYPELEPSVINYEIIAESIREHGFKGEAGRLQKLEPINYQTVTTLRLEFKNILKIDHLWILPNLVKLSLNYNKLDKIENLEMLTNLKELDLSFNYIEKIENLDNLKLLKVLSLFSNCIKRLENLDALENLVILSIGKNQINTCEGIERFRFMKKLRCLNLEGNPIAKNEEHPIRVYIAAFLPDLKYYEYSCIKEEERTKGNEIYQRELRDLAASQREEIECRTRKAKAEEDERRLSSSFVERLNETQLFDSLFEDNGEERILFLIDDVKERLLKEYRNDYYAITQEIYKLGLARYDERLKEIAMFNECIENARLAVQKQGQELVDDLIDFRDEQLLEARPLLVKIELFSFQKSEDGKRPKEITKCMENLEKIVNNFHARIDVIWQKLMESEIQLFEGVEDAIKNFNHIIQDMMNKFVEMEQTYFVQLRDVTNNFSDTLRETVMRFITLKSASGESYRIPVELKHCVENTDVIGNLVTGMRQLHLRKIDAREERLVIRSKTWVTELISKMQQDEIERNRAKIMEINYFLDQMRDSFEVLQKEIREEIFDED